MSSSDRAILFPLRVTGTAEAAQAFKSVGEAAKQAIGGVASAAAAQANFEAAAVRAQTSSAALGAAQASANRQLAEAKAAFAAGTMSAEAYATSQLDVKNSLALVKAEQGAAVAELKASSGALVAARTSAQGLNPALLNVGRSAGQTRAGFQQLGFQINDVTTQLSMGTPAMQVFAQQSGQVLQSVSMLTGGAGKFAKFMMGPWGLALTAGVSLVALLGSKLLATGDASDSTTDKTLTLHDALQKSAMGTDEARKALVDYNAEQDKARKSTEDMIKVNLADAKSRLEQAKATREQLKAKLEAAYHTRGGGPFGGENVTFAAVGDASKALAKNQADIDALNSTIGNLSIQDATRNAKGALDPVTGINQRYDDLAAKTTRAADENVKLTNALEGTLIAQGKLRKAELDRQRELDQQARATGRGAGEHGREIGMAQARSIATGAGFQVNSDTRTRQRQQELYDAWVAAGKPASNPVAVPGTSAHERSNALDIQIKPGVTRASIAKAYADQGVSLTKNFKEDGHFHIEWATTGADKAARAAEAAERKAEQQRQQAIRRAQQFGDAVAGADRSLLDAKRNNVHDAATLAALDRQDIAAVKAKTLLDIAAKEQLGDYTKVQADQLREKAEQTAAERLITIDTREAQRQADERLTIGENDLALQRDQLESQLSLAKTADERRTIQLALLEIDKRSEKARLEALAADETAAAAARADARKRLANLDSIYSDRRQATLQQTAGPGEAYLRDLSRTPDQMNEALQQVKVDGLQALNDGLVDAIVNFRSLGDVAQNVLHTVLQGLVQLSVEKYVTTPLANKLFPEQAATVANDNAAKLTVAGVEMIAAGASLTSSAALWALTATQIQLAAAALAASGGGGGGGGGGGSGGALGALFDAVLGGGSGGGGLAADVNATIAANPGVFASGTDMVPVGKPFFVGENGREMMRNRGGGRLEVINGPRTHRAVNEGGGGMTLVQHINVPERVDPRRTADGIARSTQGALARAHRKGLAMTRGRD